jgi:hypothetical protein
MSVLGRAGGQVADELESLFGGLDRRENRLLNPEQRESQLILGEVEYLLAPLVLKLTPRLEELAQLRIFRRDLPRELPPCLEVVAASRRVQEEAAGEGADLLARSVIEPLKLPALLGDLDSAALGTHPDFAQPLASCAPRLGRHPFAGPVEVPLSLCQRRLGVAQLFPQPTLALTLGLEPRECIGILSAARLEHRLDRLSQQLPRPGSPDMSGENKKQLRVPIERLGELHERLGDGPLDLTRLDPADLRSREAAPPANWFSCCEAARCGAVSGRRVLSTREAREDRCAFLASLGSTSSRAANHVPLEGDARRVSSRDSGSPGETCRCG